MIEDGHGHSHEHHEEHDVKATQHQTTSTIKQDVHHPQEAGGVAIATGRVISVPMSSLIGPITNSKALIKVKFMFADSPVPKGYIADSGLTYGKREDSSSGGLMYGWNFFHGGAIVDRARAGDIMQDQLIHMYRSKSTWEIAVPPGQYAVRVLFGDVMYLTTHTVTVEDVVMAEDLRLGPGAYQWVVVVDVDVVVDVVVVVVVVIVVVVVVMKHGRYLLTRQQALPYSHLPWSQSRMDG